MKLVFGAFAALLVMSSIGIGQPKNDANLLVGVWRQDDDTRHVIVLRRADGTYQERVHAEYDLNKPPVDYTSSGTWEVRGNRYITRCKKISLEVWSKKQAGRTYRQTIRQIEPGKFKYISTDGADVEERRIGKASEVGFAETSLTR